MMVEKSLGHENNLSDEILCKLHYDPLLNNCTAVLFTSSISNSPYIIYTTYLYAVVDNGSTATANIKPVVSHIYTNIQLSFYLKATYLLRVHADVLFFKMYDKLKCQMKVWEPDVKL